MRAQAPPDSWIEREQPSDDADISPYDFICPVCDKYAFEPEATEVDGRLICVNCLTDLEGKTRMPHTPNNAQTPLPKYPQNMNTKPQLTVEDFDNAVKQRWYGYKCIIAQFGLRTNCDIHDESFWIRMTDNSHAYHIRAAFDKHFNVPGDEKKPELVALRASLPIDL